MINCKNKYLTTIKNYDSSFVNENYLSKSKIINRNLIVFNQSNINLPIKGWFHNCFYCTSITGKYKNFFKKNCIIRVILCNKCIDKLENQSNLDIINDDVDYILEEIHKYNNDINIIPLSISLASGSKAIITSLSNTQF